MARNPQLSAVGAATRSVTALGALLNGGSLTLYNGTQPATADTAVTTQSPLATLAFATSAFGTAVGTTITAAALTAEPNIATSAAVTWMRARTSGGATVWDGSVGVRDQPVIGDRYDAELANSALVAHGVCVLTSCLVTAS